MNKLFIVLILLSSSCNDLTHEENVQPVKKLQAEVVEQLSDQGVLDAWGIMKQNGHFIIRSSNGINLVPDKQSKSLSRSITPDEKGVILYNFMENKLAEYSVGHDGKLESKTVRLPEGQQHLVAARGQDFIISTGLYEDKRYLYYSNSGEVKYFVSYPEHPDYPDMTGKVKSILYASSVLRIRPDETYFVCADMYSGTIDFCRIENKEIKLVKRLCLHVPDIRIQGIATPKIRYTKENLMGFTDMAASQEHVYALHSGKNYREAGSNFSACDELLVFDWNGNLLNAYKLPVLATSINYNSSENIIYVTEKSQNTAILKIKLPD